MRSILVLVFVLFLPSFSAGADDDRTITGRFVDTDGRPVAATVHLMYPPDARVPGGRPWLATVRTDVQGRFLLMPPAGASRLAIGALVDGRPCWWRPAVFPGWDHGEIRIDTRGVLEGIVRHGGEPIGGALIQLRLGGELSFFAEPYVVRSGDDGRFAVAGLAPGRWAVTVADERWTSAAQILPVGTRPANVEMVVRPAATVAGIVREAGGSPVPGAVVETLDGRRTTTDAQGAWTIGGLESGPVFLVARASGMTLADDTPLRVDTRAGAVTGCDIALVSAGGVDLQVSRSDGAAPPPSVLVDQGTSMATVPVVAGMATIRDVVPGQRQMTITAAGLVPETVTVAVTSGGVIRAAVRFAPARSVSGRVLDETGNAVRGAVVGVSDLQGLAHLGYDPATVCTSARRCGQDGTFRIVDVPPGMFRLIASAPGHALDLRAVEVGAGPELPHEFRLHPARSLTVHVVEEGGKAVTAARIRLDIGSPLPLEVHTDEAGVATIDGVLPGPCRVQVSAEGFLRRTTGEEIPAKGDAEVTVALDRGQRIARRLCDHQGNPVAGAHIWGGNQGAVTDQDGRFAISGMTDADQRLIVMIGPLNINVTFDGPPAGGDGEMRLPRLVEIPVRMSGPGLPSATYLEAVAEGAGAGSASGVIAYRACLSHHAGGAPVLALMPGSRYRLALRGYRADLQRFESDIDLSGPEKTWPARVDVDLKRGATVTGIIVAADGQPASGLWVVDPASRDTYGRGASQADGTFRLGGFAPGRQRIAIHLRNESEWALLSQDIVIPEAGNPPPLTVHLPPLARVDVRLDPPSSRPAQLLLRGLRPGNSQDIGCALAPGGEARFPAIPAGSYELAVYDPSYRAAGMVTVAGRDGIAVTLTPSGQAGGATISGSVPAGAGLAPVTGVIAVPLPALAWEQDDTHRWRGMSAGSVEAGGRFRLTGLAAGSWMVNWTNADGGLVWSEIRGLAQDEAVAIAPGAGGFVHRITAIGPDGLPLVGARILAKPTDAEPALQEALIRTATTGADGTAVIGLLVPGTWKLSCVSADHPTRSVVVPLTPEMHTAFRVGTGQQ